MDVLDKTVIDEIKALVANPAEVDNIIKLNQSNNNITEKKEFYKKRIKEIEKQMNKLTDLYWYWLCGKENHCTKYRQKTYRIRNECD